MDDVPIASRDPCAGRRLWIGGVAMVTTGLLPAVRRFKSPAERIAFFVTIERRFAWQACLLQPAHRCGVASARPKRSALLAC